MIAALLASVLPPTGRSLADDGAQAVVVEATEEPTPEPEPQPKPDEGDGRQGQSSGEAPVSEVAPGGSNPVNAPPVRTPPSDAPPSGKPPVDAPPIDKPKGDKPPGDKPSEGKPPGDKPSEGKPPGDKPSDGKPPGDKPSDGKPPGDNPPPDKPPEGSPDGPQRPPHDRPPHDRPPHERPPEVSPPGPPRDVSASEDDGEVFVTWLPPLDDGGSPITHYVVTAAPGGQRIETQLTTATFSELPRGHHTFTVVAHNAAGPGPAGGPTGPVAVGFTAPGAPTGVTATAGDAAATVSWTAPSDDGGAPVSGYHVRVIPTGLIGSLPGGSPAFGTVEREVFVSGGATSTTITDLLNGQPYVFTVTAENSHGRGPASAPSNVVVPHRMERVPGAPTAVEAAAGDASATVHWEPPADDGGSPVIRYTVTAVPEGGGELRSLDSDDTTAVFAGTLVNGVTYTFTVTATNAVGTGPASAPSNRVTPRGDATPPGAPTDVTATAGNATATVSWRPPADDGGSLITGFTVITSPGGARTTFPDGGATSGRITGLVNGTTYTFTVRATNAVGDGPASAPSNSVTPRSHPTRAPTITSVVDGDRSSTITWEPPEDDGGSPITSYTIRATFVDEPHLARVDAGTRSYTLTGLTNGVTYDVDVTADNAEGSGPRSTPVTLRPGTTPSAPTGVSASAGDRTATVTWTAPADDGGRPVTGYLVTASPGGATAAVAAVTTAVIDGLTNGTAYTFTVRAVNAMGTGPASAPSGSATPRGAPGAPRNVTVTPGDGSATITWDPPVDDGGSPVITYTVTVVNTATGDVRTATTPGTSVTLTGLDNAAPHQVTVTASNERGTGPAATTTVTPGVPDTPATVPGAPTGVSATAGEGSATVSWVPPADDGGSPILGYRITRTPNGEATVVMDGASTSATVTGLDAGTAYTFTVTAINAVGAGPASAPSNPVTPTAPDIPATVPGAPTDVTATPGDASATITWNPPQDDGGAPITSYTVTANPGGATITTPALGGRSFTADSGGGTTRTAADTATLGGLTNGTTYTFTVTATNSAGTGPASAPSNPVTPTPATPPLPEPPTGVVARAGNAGAAISWTPSADGSITRYVVTASPGGASVTTAGDASSAVVFGLEMRTRYTFTVRAGSATGVGAASAASNPVVIGGPDDTGTARATVSSLVVEQGGVLIVEGEGWLPGSTVTIELRSTPVLLGVANVDRNGRFRQEVRIPDDTPPGRHTLVLTGLDFDGLPRQVFIPLTILAAGTGGPGPTRPPAVPTSRDRLPTVAPGASGTPGTSTTSSGRGGTGTRAGSTTGALPQTGLEVGGLLASGLLLLSLGGSLVAGTGGGRRRRRLRPASRSEVR